MVNLEHKTLRKPRRLTFLHRNRVGPTGLEFVSPGIELDPQDLNSFPQELNWTHRIWICFPRNWVGPTGFEFVPEETNSYPVRPNSIPVETNSNPVRPNSIPVETNSNPDGRTRFLWKKVSLRGFRKHNQTSDNSKKKPLWEQGMRSF